MSASYKLVVVGGGAGGLSIASKFARILPKKSIAVVEPAKNHFNQPLWTLVGAGIKTPEDSRRDMASVMPSAVDWIHDSAVTFNPEKNSLTTSSEKEIKYEFLLLAAGLKVDFDAVPGLREALNDEGSGVCSNYSFETVTKTWKTLQQLKSGNALFTFPDSPVKCAGAPQKIMYLTEDYLSKNGRKKDVSIHYFTSLPAMFGVKKYSDRLASIAQSRGIHVNLRHHLISVDGRKATFQNLDSKEKKTLEFSMLHVTPPQRAHKEMKPFADASGFVAVNPKTMQHSTFPNVFGIGDCTNVPISKTAAAVAGQSGIVFRNLKNVMDGRKPDAEYNGYTSCPLVTSYKTCMLAEFDYTMQPRETFFFDQGKERQSMFFLKKNIIPLMYWQMIAGRWNGPGPFRRILNPLSSG